MKWCSLPYEEATWELQEDLDPEKIKEFEEVQKLPVDCGHMVSRRRKFFCNLKCETNIFGEKNFHMVKVE